MLGLDGGGGAEAFADYSQWEEDRESSLPRKGAAEAPKLERSSGPKKKLSYLDQREWEQMETRILEAEAELERCQEGLHDPEVVSDAGLLQRAYDRMQAAQARVDELYARWAELESKLA